MMEGNDKVIRKWMDHTSNMIEGNNKVKKGKHHRLQNRDSEWRLNS